MDLKRFGKGFKYAWRGIGELWRREQNFRIELIFAILIMVVCQLLGLRLIEKMVVIMMSLLVLLAEATNSVLENLLDGMSARFNERFRIAKDIMAGITLITVIGSVIIGVIIFYPYIRIWI